MLRSAGSRQLQSGSASTLAPDDRQRAVSSRPSAGPSRGADRGPPAPPLALGTAAARRASAQGPGLHPCGPPVRHPASPSPFVAAAQAGPARTRTSLCSNKRALDPACAVPRLGGGDGALVTQPAIHGWSLIDAGSQRCLSAPHGSGRPRAGAAAGFSIRILVGVARGGRQIASSACAGTNHTPDRADLSLDGRQEATARESDLTPSPDCVPSMDGRSRGYGPCRRRSRRSCRSSGRCR